MMGFLILVAFIAAAGMLYALGQYEMIAVNYVATSTPVMYHPPTLNKALYDAKLAYIARPLSVDLALQAAALASSSASSTSSSTPFVSTSSKPFIPPLTASSSSRVAISTTHATSTATTTPPLWPVKTVYPNYGALLPFNRIVAYYGNYYSTAMGVLGEYPSDQVLSMLMDEVAKWREADPNMPVIPAIDYIAVSAQGQPGPDGKYRLRMPDSQIQKAIDMANQVNGIVILDVQVGQSTVEDEVPALEKYLEMPNVELALDPEFDMDSSGKRPGSVIGTMDASDINFVADYLAKLVQENNIPPKILIVHRFTEDMVTNTGNITPLPEVQVVMDMDGFGTAAQKTKIYKEVVSSYPVQFTGIKLFYKNDAQAVEGMMTDTQVLNLTPQPSFIQYQ